MNGPNNLAWMSILLLYSIVSGVSLGIGLLTRQATFRRMNRESDSYRRWVLKKCYIDLTH